MGQQSSSARAPRNPTPVPLSRQQSIALNGGAIPDFSTLADLLAYMRKCAIIEDMNIIIGIDGTQSNETSGLLSFGRSMHDNTKGPSPYAQVVQLLQKTLAFDSDHVFPLYIFGSHQANQQGGVLHVGNYDTVDALLQAYLTTMPTQILSGPTTFECLFEEAIAIVKQTGRFHLVLIVTDGQTDPSTRAGHVRLLKEMANYPLAVVCIGVGDSDFSDMRKFDDDVEDRVDVFNFVHFNEVKKKGEKADEELMLQVLMEVPDQYLSAQTRLGYKPQYGPLAGKAPARPPPPYA